MRTAQQRHEISPLACVTRENRLNGIETRFARSYGANHLGRWARVRDLTSRWHPMGCIFGMPRVRSPKESNTAGGGQMPGDCRMGRDWGLCKVLADPFHHSRKPVTAFQGGGPATGRAAGCSRARVSGQRDVR